MKIFNPICVVLFIIVFGQVVQADEPSKQETIDYIKKKLTLLEQKIKLTEINGLLAP